MFWVSVLCVIVDSMIGKLYMSVGIVPVGFLVCSTTCGEFLAVDDIPPLFICWYLLFDFDTKDEHGQSVYHFSNPISLVTH